MDTKVNSDDGEVIECNHLDPKPQLSQSPLLVVYTDKCEPQRISANFGLMQHNGLHQIL